MQRFLCSTDIMPRNRLLDKSQHLTHALDTETIGIGGVGNKKSHEQAVEEEAGV